MVIHQIQRLVIEYSPIDKLKPNPRNPKTHSDRQSKQLARSIKQFGFISPVLTDRDGNVLAGHGRLLAAKLCGYSTVPVIRIEHLTEEQALAYMIADNRLAEHASWDEQLLGQIFSELAAVELDFGLEVTGFTLGEIDLKIEELNQAGAAEPDPADELPVIPNTPALTQFGDLWQLGKHRILCGNAIDAASFEALMQGKLANVIFTDPPYNLAIDGFALRHGQDPPSRIRHGIGRDEPRPIHRLPDDSMPSPGGTQHRGIGPFHLHRLAAPPRAADRRNAGLHRDQKHLRLGQEQRWNGLPLSQPARADLCLQARKRVTP